MFSRRPSFALIAATLCGWATFAAATPPDTVGDRRDVLVAVPGRIHERLAEHLLSVSDRVLCVGEVRFHGGTHVGLWFSDDPWLPCAERVLPPAAVTLLGWSRSRDGYNYYFAVGRAPGPVGTFGEFIKTGRIVLTDLCTEDYQNRCDLVLTGERPMIRPR
jgi:hypothetical protein